MNTAAVILSIALTFRAPAKSAEPRAEYETRLATMSLAIADVARTREEAAAILVLWYRESSFRLDVHEGSLLGDKGKAACLGQIWPHVDEWRELTGTSFEATRRCAEVTRRLLRSAERRCAGAETDFVVRQAYAFEGYAHGQCRLPGGESWNRSRASLRVSSRLWNEGWRPEP